MKELEKEFIGTGEVKGSTFKQIAHSLHASTYEITTIYGDRYYETFSRKELKNTNTVIEGKDVHFDAKVQYPKSKDFGVWAWCIRDKEKALKMFHELSKAEARM